MSNWKEFILDALALICIFGAGYLMLHLAPGADAVMIEMKGQ